MDKEKVEELVGFMVEKNDEGVKMKLKEILKEKARERLLSEIEENK